MNCGSCLTCQWKSRWEAQYTNYLKNNPSKSHQEFIKRMRKTDLALVCYRELENFDESLLDFDPSNQRQVDFKNNWDAAFEKYHGVK